MTDDGGHFCSDRYWYVGKRDEKALGQGWVQVRSLAPVPEQIRGVWSVWNSADRRWVEAPSLRISPDDAEAPESVEVEIAFHL